MQHGNGDTIPIQVELPVEQPVPIYKRLGQMWHLCEVGLLGTASHGHFSQHTASDNADCATR